MTEDTRSPQQKSADTKAARKAQGDAPDQPADAAVDAPAHLSSPQPDPARDEYWERPGGQ